MLRQHRGTLVASLGFRTGLNSFPIPVLRADRFATPSDCAAGKAKRTACVQDGGACIEPEMLVQGLYLIRGQCQLSLTSAASSADFRFRVFGIVSGAIHGYFSELILSVSWRFH